MTAPTQAEVFNKAAEILESKVWYQSGKGDHTDNSPMCCVWTALVEATEFFKFSSYTRYARPLVASINNRGYEVSHSHDTDLGGIFLWNDNICPDKATAVAVLREAGTL